LFNKNKLRTKSSENRTQIRLRNTAHREFKHSEKHIILKNKHGIKEPDTVKNITEDKSNKALCYRRGRGIGNVLAQKALLEAKRLGYAKMRVDTLATMTAALEL
jgi:hypothetical protein